MIKLCVFDLDGLLIDTERRMWRANGLKSFEEMGYKGDPEFLNTLMGASHDIYKRRVKEKYGEDFDIEHYMELIREKNDYDTRNVSFPLMKGAKELLEYLKNNNIKTAIATSTPRENALFLIKNACIYDYFDLIVCGNEIKNGKPSPDIFLKAINDSNGEISTSVIFEDGHNGALAAYRTKARYVLVPDLAYLDEDDLNNAYQVLNDLSEMIEIIRKENEGTSCV